MRSSSVLILCIFCVFSVGLICEMSKTKAGHGIWYLNVFNGVIVTLLFLLFQFLSSPQSDRCPAL